MSTIKLPEPGLLATFARAIRANDESPCAGNKIRGCDSTTVEVAYAMNVAGSNFLKVYNGPRCPHGYPTSEGSMAYMLDNYSGLHAIKAPCTPDWKSLLHGTVAILFYMKAHGGDRPHAFDIWAVNKALFHPEILDAGAAKEVWIWSLGKAPKVQMAKKQHHSHKKHKVAIF